MPPNPTDNEEIIYESPPSEPDYDLWLEHGRKMVNEAPATIRSAAGSLMTGLGALQGIYLGILGFAKFIPEDIAVIKKFVFITPMIPWMIALYHCLQVMMTSLSQVNLNSPGEIRRQYEEWVTEKQRGLELAFWWMLAGLIAAILLVIFRLKI